MCIKAVKNIEAPFIPVSSGERPVLEDSEKPFVENDFKPVKIDDNGEKLVYEEDTLAKTTYYTRRVFDLVDGFNRWFQNSNFYKVLFGTTQPAHFITALAVLAVAFLVYPSQFNESKLLNGTFSPILMIIYLGCFSTHFGSQIWMTFVSGLSLYFNIPRHTFGSIQKVLFPRYFLMNACLSFMTLTIFMMQNKSQIYKAEIAIQAVALTICFLAELLIRLYLTGPLLHLICVKTQIEKAAGVGMEIGRLNPGSLMDCPYYLKIHRTFRRTHVTIAIGNMVSMGCSFLHLYYLSQKICGF